MYYIVSCSQNPASRSRAMAEFLVECFARREAPAELIDLQQRPLPMCDGGACYGDPEVQRIAGDLAAAEGIILATPIYNYDVNAAAKNLVELTGKNVWADKVVGFVCAAGGQVSYMAPMQLANSLMLDFRSFVLPNFVFATGKAFDEQQAVTDEDVRARMQRLAETMIRVSRALRSDHA